MKIERLFDYASNVKNITTNNGDIKVRHIRKGPRGIIALVVGLGSVRIWDKEVAETHKDDLEADLLTKLVEVINS